MIKKIDHKFCTHNHLKIAWYKMIGNVTKHHLKDIGIVWIWVNLYPDLTTQVWCITRFLETQIFFKILKFIKTQKRIKPIRATTTNTNYPNFNHNLTTITITQLKIQDFSFLLMTKLMISYKKNPTFHILPLQTMILYKLSQTKTLIIRLVIHLKRRSNSDLNHKILLTSKIIWWVVMTIIIYWISLISLARRILKFQKLNPHHF